MTIRERRRQRRLIKRLAAAGLILLAVGGATLAIIAATSRQEATEPPFTRTVEGIPTASPEATTEPTTAPQRGRDLGWSASEEYIAARMAMAEAEGEDTEGKALVILVIYNRTKARGRCTLSGRRRMGKAPGIAGTLNGFSYMGTIHFIQRRRRKTPVSSAPTKPGP